MSKRRQTLSNKLGTRTTKPGWQDTITPQTGIEEEPEEEQISKKRATRRTRKPKKSQAKLIRRTYLMSPDLLERLEVVAEDERVGISELLRYLITQSLDMIETGEIEIPTTAGKRSISL